ncbi:MAG: V-type ATP synthase subunit I [Coriobacteriia bacterium]|nr:V-type ATP synthase subunit I [Coriobacteriia bacterium]
MAVARMLRATVVVHKAAVDDVVDRLQSAGALDLEAVPYELPGRAVSSDDEARLRWLDEQIADAKFVVEVLGKRREDDRPFAAFVSEKIHLDAGSFEALEPDAAFQTLYQECLTLTDRIASGERERERLRHLIAELEPWRDLRIEVQRLRDTEQVRLLTGTVPAAQGAAIRQRLREVSPLISVEELGPVGSRAAWVVLAHRSVVDEARATLALTSYRDVAFPSGVAGYPAEEIELARDAIARIEEERDRYEERLRELAARRYRDVVALLEALLSEREAVLARESMGATDRTVVITGWVPAKRRAELEASLAAAGHLVDYELREPLPDEEPPVELDNPRLLKPFELLTDLYGRPRYRDIDPTPLIAPFFLLFFSICIGDVGYGLMLIAGFWFIKHRIDVAWGVKRFCDLMMLGGVGAMVAGVAFGSYFALDYEAVRAVVPVPRLLDPLGQLTTFLLFTVVIGMVQVFFGVLVAAYDAARQQDYSSAIGDQLSTILLAALIGVAAAVPAATGWALALGLGGAMLLKGHAIEAALAKDEQVAAWDRAIGVGWVVLFIAWVMVLAFDGPAVAGWILLACTAVGLAVSKSVRRAVAGLLGGAYAVYGMTSFMGDILSYTRLAALGLSGTLVGMVFNILANLVWSGASGLFSRGPVGIVAGAVVALLAAAVFVGGHVFNVVINLLGAFVHPARLQFVEFFGKFYGNGGTPFAPFAYKTKAVVLHPAGAQREGGVRS